MFRGIFKLPAGHIADDRPHAARRAPGSYWDCAPDRADDAERARPQRDRGGRRADAPAAAVDRPADGVRRAVRRAAVGRRRFVDERRADERADGAAGDDLHHRLRRARRTTTSSSTRGGSASRYKTDHHETLINRDEMQEFLPLLVRLQDEPIADNVCIPLYFLAQAGEGQRHHRRAGRRRRGRELPRLLVVRALPADGRGRVSAGASATAVVAPSSRRRSASRAPRCRAKRSKCSSAPRRGEELFWGGAACWWGDRCGERLTPDPTPFRADDRLPGRRAWCPDSHRALDSHAVVARVPRPLDGRLDEPDGAAEDSVPGDEAAAAGAPADARRQADDGARRRGARAVSRSRCRRLRHAAAAVVQAARRRRQDAC